MVRFLVLGYGAMGKIIIRDLFEFAKKSDDIIVAGRDAGQARKIAAGYRSKRVKAAYADVTKHGTMLRAFKDVDIVIHAVHHEFNVGVMKACLAARCDYTDLGGLFHWVKPQLKLHGKFKRAGLTAVISMGAAPGITDVLARHASDQLDRVSAVDILVGTWDGTKIIRPSPLSSSYSIETIFQEFSYKPAVMKNGRVKFVDPLSGREPYTFPKPVGNVKPMYTIHSEVATIPHALKAKGIRDCSFRIAFDDDFVNKVRFLRELGILSEKPIEIGGRKITPKDFTAAVVKRLPPPIKGKPNEYEILRAIVKGRKKGKPRTITVDCHVKGMPAWNVGVDIDTGAPPSVVAQMIMNGAIDAKGVHTAGEAVPPKRFFKELKKRRMDFYQNGRKIFLR